MGSLGGMEFFIILIAVLLPGVIVVGYFLWLGIKVKQITEKQKEQSRNMKELVKFLREES